MKSYAEQGDDDSDPPNGNSDDDDESFDEDDDPDKIEVPGGGKNLEAAKHLHNANTMTAQIKTEAGTARGGLPYPSSWPSSSTASGMTASKLLKQETLGSVAASAIGGRSQQGGGTFSVPVPSPLADTSVFLRLAEPVTTTQGMATSSPLDNITQNFFNKFLSQQSMNPAFAHLYNALLG